MIASISYRPFKKATKKTIHSTTKIPKRNTNHEYRSRRIPRVLDENILQNTKAPKLTEAEQEKLDEKIALERYRAYNHCLARMRAACLMNTDEAQNKVSLP